MAKLKLTKTELKTQQNAFKQFSRFLPTLQLKKQQLQMEMRESAARLRKNEEEQEKTRKSLNAWIALFGDEEGLELLPALLKLTDVAKGTTNIAGVNVPVFEKANFEVAHGQMKPRELENTMMRFLNREIDVLVCTTIIESGLDIPSANTIIINEADRLGLAQIYQLRGRVGRAREKAYAYLLISRDSSLTRDAEKRLKALMDFSNLGAGLHLAMHDLKIRGGGNILGFSQSGHISAVGYELYLKLIERTVTELKGEQWQDEVNPEININIPAFLPGDYILDTDVRLNLYRRLSALIENSELEEMIQEIHDRFGNPPPEVKNLLALMSIRLRLSSFVSTSWIWEKTS